LGRGRARRGAAGGREAVVRAGHLDHRREVAHHVGHRRRHDRLAGRHVLERLGGVDVLGGLVERERHQAHVERLGVLRQLGVLLLAEPADVRRLGQVVRVDLHHRARHGHSPLREGLGEVGDERV
ncbi:MAG: hypothetical protein AVDCRST_MAG40-3402, partial [uncultured Gemmatimonadaceae bacterium]